MANLISGRAFKHSGVWEFDGEVRLRGVALTKLSVARGHRAPAHRPCGEYRARCAVILPRKAHYFTDSVSSRETRPTSSHVARRGDGSVASRLFEER